MQCVWKRALALLLAAALAVCLAGCGAGGSSSAPRQDFTSASGAGQPPGQPAAPAQGAGNLSYRAVWVSYLEWQNFDFSSEAAFTAAAGRLLGNCKALGLNTVIAQVRPFGDALYPSALFPWSHLVTGTQGQDPGYDPLAILVREAHSRGLLLEAWVNPYRIRLSEKMPPALADTGLAAVHPDWVKEAAGGLWLDPASPAVRDYIVDGVAEILQNYQVDGIQFDDYFYPTTDESFDAEDYAASGTALGLADWRRENVNALVRAAYDKVKELAPHVAFGISPQGNNDNNYNGQYSDVAMWLSTPGYVDYVMPQVYWGYDFTLQSGSQRYAFANIVSEWLAMPRDPSVHLAFGLGAFRIGDGDGSAQASDEWQSGGNLARMVATLQDKGADGYALYRYDNLFNSAYPELAAAETAALTGANAPG